ncbi:MAG: hypothetical protein HYU66_23355 [Armatimonadetes bacterium]|nr:hypothetical protein [Armatimonadota bacterium]
MAWQASELRSGCIAGWRRAITPKVCKHLRLTLGSLSVTVVLNDSATASAVAAAAPFEAVAHRWGAEIYFGLAVTGDETEASAATVELGEVGFWPPGQALCLFFGPTPLSVGDEIRPASPVTRVGRLEGGAAVWSALSEVVEGTPVTAERLSRGD